MTSPAGSGNAPTAGSSNSRASRPSERGYTAGRGPSALRQASLAYLSGRHPPRDAADDVRNQSDRPRSANGACRTCRQPRRSRLGFAAVLGRSAGVPCQDDDSVPPSCIRATMQVMTIPAFERIARDADRRFHGRNLRVRRSPIVHAVAQYKWIGNLTLPGPACRTITCRKCLHAKEAADVQRFVPEPAVQLELLTPGAPGGSA